MAEELEILDGLTAKRSKQAKWKEAAGKRLGKDIRAVLFVLVAALVILFAFWFFLYLLLLPV
jgi:hypothetical protein